MNSTLNEFKYYMQILWKSILGKLLFVFEKFEQFLSLYGCGSNVAIMD